MGRAAACRLIYAAGVRIADRPGAIGSASILNYVVSYRPTGIRVDIQLSLGNVGQAGALGEAEPPI